MDPESPGVEPSTPRRQEVHPGLEVSRAQEEAAEGYRALYSDGNAQKLAMVMAVRVLGATEWNTGRVAPLQRPKPHTESYSRGPCKSRNPLPWKVG